MKNKVQMMQRVNEIISEKTISTSLANKIKEVSSLRPLQVIYHILEQGEVSTETLTSDYGYNHAPRATRDVRELGIPLKTDFAKNSEGKRMAVYSLDFEADAENQKKGRQAFAKKVKTNLLQVAGTSCSLCNGEYSSLSLQVDHRVPYEIGGELTLENIDERHLMLLCPSSNSSKSWECEHCENWINKDANHCSKCYWSGELEYEHIASKDEKRDVLTWQNHDDLTLHERINSLAEKDGVTISSKIKSICIEKLILS